MQAPRKFQARQRTVHAVEITEATFDDPHPNPEHVPGVIYHPRARIVSLANGGTHGHIGDWIVQEENGRVTIYTAEEFAATFEPKPDLS